MKIKEQDKIFNYLKNQLENEFGIVPDNMVYALRDVCDAFPDFLKYFKSCFNMTILEALNEYLNLIKKKRPIFLVSKIKIHKPKNDTVYYLLLGMLFMDAFLLTNTKSNIDYTDSINEYNKNTSTKTKYRK